MVKVMLEAIVPKEALKVDEVRLELLNAFRAQGREIRQEYQKTTATWKDKPRFEIDVSLTRAAGTGGVEVSTTNEIFGYVDLGTRPHIIKPKSVRRGAGGRFRKRARTLAFPSRFRPKTRPGRIASSAGYSGGPTVFAPVVRHPGTQPRRFSDTIARRLDRGKEWPKRVQAAIDKGLARAAAKAK